MESDSNFQVTLTEALFRKREYIESNLLELLKEQFRVVQNQFQSIYNILLRKSLIQEDPYRYDKKISEVSIPSQEPFGESKKQEELSLRLSDYDTQLDFLNNYYTFTLDFLNMDRVKKMADLIKYIRWDTVTETSSNLITRTLAQTINKIKQGSDTMSAKIITDAIAQAAKASKRIITILKEISEWYREKYKLDFREKVLSYIRLSSSVVQNKMDDALKLVKQKYAANMADQPFYQALITEVLQESYGEYSEGMQQELLEKLKVKEDKPKKTKKTEAYYEILLDGIRILASASIHLEAAVRKLEDSNQLIINRKLTFGERFRRWLLNISNKNQEQQIYEIEYFDGQSTSSKTEKINFTKFTAEVKRRSQILANLASKMSTQYRRLEQAPEDQIFGFMNRNLEEIQLFLRRLPALDTFFKAEVSKEQRPLIRGIKIEINAVKNAFVKANQKKHEYVSKHEEIEQLKKLGIKMD